VTSILFSYNGVLAPTSLTYTSATTAAQVQSYLGASFATINGNVSVSGPAGGPFVITYINALAGLEFNPLTVANGGAGTAVLTETLKGGQDPANASLAVVRKEFGGSLILTADNSDLTSAVTVNQGVLQIQNSNGLGRVDNMQTIALTGTLTGYFTVQYGGVSSALLQGSTLTAPSLQAALAAMPTIGAGNVVVEYYGPATFLVHFVGARADTNVTLLTTAAFGLTVTVTPRTGATPTTVVNTGAELQLNNPSTPLNIGNQALTLNGNGQLNEIQTLNIIGATSGNFTLSFGGQTSGSLPYNATAAQVQTALNSLTSIGQFGGSVAVSYSPTAAAGTAGSFYAITFARRFGDTTFGLKFSPLTNTIITVNSSLGVSPGGAVPAAATVAVSGLGMNYLGSAPNGTGALHQIAGTSTWGVTQDAHSRVHRQLHRRRRRQFGAGCGGDLYRDDGQDGGRHAGTAGPGRQRHRQRRGGQQRHPVAE
jgi:hypothetical protein